MPETLLSFDVGGGHITAGVFRESLSHPEKVTHIELPPNEGADGFLAWLSQLGEILLRPSEAAAGLAFATPAPFDYSQGISLMTHKLPGIYRLDLRLSVANHFKCSPARVSFCNDADAFLLGEVMRRQNPPHRAIGITLGTGIGCAFIEDRVILHQGSGVPPMGEIWNLPWGNGIVEDVVSSKALSSAYAVLTGERLSVRDIALRANCDSLLYNPDAQLAFEYYGTHLGQVLRPLQDAFRPNAIFLGGGISKSLPLFMPKLVAELDNNVEVRATTDHDIAAIVGAATHWHRAQDEWK